MSDTARLSNKTIGSLPSSVAIPTYDRSLIRPGIVHLGVGAFHRAHQAVFTDDCLNRGERDWGIIGASLRSPATRDALAPQDNLYTLAERSGDQTSLRVVGALQSMIVAAGDSGALMAALIDPRIRVVSLTITEKGYTADLNSGDLLSEHPDIVHDLKAGGQPRTALGFVARALAERRGAGHAPFTLLSCDNLPANGKTLHRALTQFAELMDPEFGRFVADQVACPSTMVDRIVPATTDDDRRSVSAALGVEDAWPVMAEPFAQWVVEDQFTSGRPSWERSGVEFVGDVAPYEHMKLRLLNGAHTAIAAIGRVAGHDTVATAIGDPAVSNFVKALWEEVIPTVDRNLDCTAYTASLLGRFANTALQHKTAQIASDASQKLPQRILGPLRERSQASAPTGALTFAVAAWIRSCAGVDEAGRALVLNDPVFDSWAGRPDQASASSPETVAAFLGFTSVFGDDLAANSDFRRDLAAALDDIKHMGILAASRRRAPGNGAA
jgi:fructuronate reductase